MENNSEESNDDNEALQLFGIIIAIFIVVLTIVILIVWQRSQKVGRNVLLIGLYDAGKTLLYARLTQSRFVEAYKSAKENISDIGIQDIQTMSAEVGVIQNKNIPSFKHFFSTDVFLLRFIGASSMNGVLTDLPRVEKWWELLPFISGILIPGFVVLCEFVTVYIFAKSDINYMVKALTATFSGVLSILKGIRLWTHRVELYSLLRNLAKLWESARSHNNITQKMIETAERTKFVRSAYCCVLLVLALSYCLRPYILLLNHLVHSVNETYDFTILIYPATYPFFCEQYGQYLICLAYEVVAMVCVMSYWLTCDGLFVQIITQLSLQFEVLSHELIEITAYPELYGEENYMHEKLSRIAKRHNELYSWCSVAEDFFSPIVFLTMLINGAHCCFCMYSLEKEISNGNVDEIVKNLFFIVALSGQTILYCGYADRLTHKSAEVCEAIYNSQWTNQGKRFRLMLLTMLMRVQKTYSFTAYGIISLNLQKVTAIANAAMRYFTLLRSAT